MRTFILITFLTGFSYLVLAQSPSITPHAARSKVGETVTIKGKVAQVVVRSKVCYLNFTYPYPDNELVAVVFKQNFNRFGDLKKYEGKIVTLTGKVSTYRGNPQIKLHHPKNIAIVK